MSRLARMLYIDVSIRTSIFPMLLGLTVAVASGAGTLDWRTMLALVASVVGVIVVQGFEHAYDVLRDKGGFSAFRSSDLEPVAERYVRIFPLLAAPLLAAIIVAERPWLIITGAGAARMSKLYVESHNEWYAVAGFMLAYATGWFTATNVLTLPFLAGFVLTGFIYKASLSMYRLDDYLDGEMPSVYATIQYYRNIFRYTLHYTPILVAILVVSVTHPLPVYRVLPYGYAAWLAGWAAMAAYAMRYRGNRLNQEAPIWTVILPVAATDMYAAYTVSAKMLALYAILYATLAMIVYAFWESRHAMCNITRCGLNPLRYVSKPR